MAYTQDQWLKAKGLYEAGEDPQTIADRLGFKSRDTVYKRAKKEDWEKDKILQEKAEILGLERENSTISEKNSTMLEKISTMESYQIDILKDLVEDATKSKSIIFTGLNMAAIRATQQLQKNTKREMIKVKEGFGAGVSKEYFEEIESELNANDIKAHTETLVKVGQGVGLIEKDGSSVTVNTQNNQLNQAPKTLSDYYKEEILETKPTS